jgi:endonuclease/exonuclease/phosphatase family metal-dependent hydrolase
LHAAYAEPSLPPTPDPPECPDQVDVRLGVAVLSRWPIVSVEAPMLPSTHRQPRPVALVAEVAPPDGALWVLTSCLDWEPAHLEDRCAQAATLAAVAADGRRDGALPVVVAGDFNAARDSAATDQGRRRARVPPQ